jgi:hypothetical protein
VGRPGTRRQAYEHYRCGVDIAVFEPQRQPSANNGFDAAASGPANPPATPPKAPSALILHGGSRQLQCCSALKDRPFAADVLGLRCSWCPGTAPMPKLIGLHALPPARGEVIAR